MWTCPACGEGEREQHLYGCPGTFTDVDLVEVAKAEFKSGGRAGKAGKVVGNYRDRSSAWLAGWTVAVFARVT